MLFSKCLRAKIYSNMNGHFDPQGCQTLLLKESEHFFLSFGLWTIESLDKTCTRYKMEIRAEKTKLMTNSANGIQREIKVIGLKLDTVTSFKYLGAVAVE